MMGPYRLILQKVKKYNQKQDGQKLFKKVRNDIFAIYFASIALLNKYHI